MSRNPFLEMLTAPEQEIPGTFWATVTATNPLRVKRDAEPVLPVTPQTLANLAVGDRVLCLWERRQVIVLGRMGGPEVAYPAPNRVRIDGQNYALSGRNWNVPSFSWDYSEPPLYRATIAMPVPYTPPDGWTFTWSVAHSTAFVFVDNATYNIVDGTQRVRVLQLSTPNTANLAALNWQLVQA